MKSIISFDAFPYIVLLLFIGSIIFIGNQPTKEHRPTTSISRDTIYKGDSILVIEIKTTVIE